MKKNLKRLSALILCLCMVAMTLVAVPVSATGTAVAVDDFETGNVGTISGTSSMYYTSSSASGLFVKPNNTIGKHLSISTDKGYNGGSALYAHCDTSTAGSGTTTRYTGSTLATRAITLTSNSAFIMRYKLNFESFPKNALYDTTLAYMSAIREAGANPASSGQGFHLRTDNKIYGNGTTSGNFSVTNGEWYDVVTMVKGTGTNKHTSVYILNEAGEIELTAERDITKVTSDTVHFWPFYVLSYVYTTDTPLRFVVDNAKLMEYTTDLAPGIDSFGSNIANNDKNIALDKTFNLAFDQAMTAPVYGEGGTVKLYKTSDATKTPVSAKIENVTFNSFTLNPDSNLESNTEYTIDISALTNTSNKAVEDTYKTINFKTLDAATDPVTFDSASYGSLRKPFTADSKVGLNDNIYLTFDKAVATPSENAVTITGATGSVPVSLSVEADGKTVKVSHANAFLLNNSYTIDFSGITSKAGGGLIGDTTSFVFSTVENRKAELWQEDFESITTDEAGVPLSGYEDSEVISNEYTAESPVIRKGVGVNGSNGIQITKDSNNYFQPRTIPLEFDYNETVFVEYKFKFNSIDIRDTETSLEATCGSFKASTADAESILKITRKKFDRFYFCKATTPIEPMYFNTWYTVVFKITKATTETADNFITTAYVYDEDGLFVCENTKKIVPDDANDPTFYLFVEAKASRFDLCIDDLKIYRIAGSHKFNLVGKNSSIENGKMKPSKHFTLTFNQPMDKLTAAYNSDSINKVKLYKGDTQIDTKVSYVGANELRLTPSEELIDGATYTLKFANDFLPLSGNGSYLSEMDFELTPTYDVKAKECALSLVPTDGSLAAGTDISLSLTNSSSAIGDAVIVAAFYSGDRLKKLVDMEIFENVSIGAGNSTVPLTLSDNYSGVGYVEFMLYDSLTSLKPLMHSYKVK